MAQRMARQVGTGARPLEESAHLLNSWDSGTPPRYSERYWALRGKKEHDSPPVTAVGNLEVAQMALFRWTVCRGEVLGVCGGVDSTKGDGFGRRGSSSFDGRSFTASQSQSAPAVASRPSCRAQQHMASALGVIVGLFNRQRTGLRLEILGTGTWTPQCSTKHPRGLHHQKRCLHDQPTVLNCCKPPFAALILCAGLQHLDGCCGRHAPKQFQGERCVMNKCFMR